MNQSQCIFLDYNSTTPIDARVLAKMIHCFRNNFGNASSENHFYGKIAAKVISEAREQVSKLINCNPKELIFTSGSTEGINLALKGIVNSSKKISKKIITVSTEHKAVMDTCAYLESIGLKISYLEVDENGLIDLEELKNEITDDTILVSVMLANNESSVIHAMEAISKITKKHNIPLFSDATQAVGKIAVDVQKLGVDLMTFSSHKMYGPKGIGGLYIRSGITMEPLIHGGGHEQGMRAGTYNVPSIVGFGEACSITQNNLAEEIDKITKLRDKLEKGLLELGKAKINGLGANRLPNTSNILHYGLDADTFVNMIGHEIAISTGSACTSAHIEPSHVLKAMSLSDEEANSSIRYSLGRYTTNQEIEKVISILAHKMNDFK